MFQFKGTQVGKILSYLGKMKVKVSQSCLTLCNPMVCVVHGVLPDRIPEQVAFLFSRGSSNPGIKPRFPTLQAGSLPSEPLSISLGTFLGWDDPLEKAMATHSSILA